MTSCHQCDVSRNAIDYSPARALRKWEHFLHSLSAPLAVDSEVLEDPNQQDGKRLGPWTNIWKKPTLWPSTLK